MEDQKKMNNKSNLTAEDFPQMRMSCGWLDSKLTMYDQIEKLKIGLKYALLIIQSYEMDIRNSDWIGVDLIEKGFCQGKIYKEARKDVLRRSGLLEKI